MPTLVADLSTISGPIVHSLRTTYEILDLSEVVEKWKSHPGEGSDAVYFWGKRELAAAFEFVDKFPGASFPLIPDAFRGRFSLFDALDEFGVRHVPHRVASTLDEAEGASDSLPGPWAVVSADGLSERAVAHAEELSLAYRYVGGGRVSVEPVLDVPRVTLQGMYADGRARFRAAIRHGERRKYHRYPMALDAPADLDADTVATLHDDSLRALRAFGGYASPFSITWVKAEAGPWLVEDLHPCPWSDPAPPEFAAVANGLSLEAFHLPDAESSPSPVAVRWFDPPTGRVDRVDGLDEARGMDGVVCVETGIRPGNDIRHMVTRAERDAAGYVVATGGDASDAAERAHAAADRVRFVTRNVLNA